MSEADNNPSRRGFLKSSSAVIAAGALAGVAVPHVFAAEGDNAFRIALIGCGGRGSGAAANALSATATGPVKLVAMADVFEERIAEKLPTLKEQFKDAVDVPKNRQFVGFDGYQHAMDCLRPGDVVILTTPPAFRWVHFRYAIDHSLNCFMEKPVTVDGASTRRMFVLADEALDKNLKVGVGLMCRHCVARSELFDRIQMGQMGDLVALRCYRMHGPVAECFVPPNDGKISEVLYQVRNFHSFLWASGGLFNDFYIHNLDECCWMKNAWPIKAEAVGGRHFRGDMVDQNFDSYDVEYTFADGGKLFVRGRTMENCANQFASYAHGSKGIAQISANGHTPAKCKIWRGQDMSTTPLWSFTAKEPNPYQLEWDHLIEAIRKDKPYNEVRRGAEASLACNMGRMSAHIGQPVTRDQALNSDHEFAPTVASLTSTGPAPLVADSDGKYPVPMPGKKTREF
jgi:predicted dehydrogenase